MDKTECVNLWKYSITGVLVSKTNSYNSQTLQNNIYSFRYTTALSQVGKQKNYAP